MTKEQLLSIIDREVKDGERVVCLLWTEEQIREILESYDYEVTDEDSEEIVDYLNNELDWDISHDACCAYEDVRHIREDSWVDAKIEQRMEDGAA